MRVLRHADYAAEPWRNGRGTARSIVQGDGWQVRLADIEASGPFSDHPDRLRHFAIVSGAVVLRFSSGDTIDCDPRSAVATYPGAPAPFCELISSQPARAFNLIVDHGRAVGAIERLRVDRGVVRVPFASGGMRAVAILVQAGSLVARGAGETGPGMPVGHLDTLTGIAPDGADLQALAGASVVLVARTGSA